MDLLQDILQQCGLKMRILGHRTFTRSTNLEFPCNKSVGFHVVTQGRALLHVQGKAKPIELQAGDIALMARGCHHMIKTEAKLTLVSGAYQLWNDPVHPLFQEVPDWFVIKSSDLPSFERLPSLIQLLAQEIAQPQIGSQRVIHGLLDILFALILRQMVRQISARPETWSHAFHDSRIRKSLELIHANPAHPWTLSELAKSVGLSRASFAAKFKGTLGDTPLHYLTTIRVQKAIELLSSTNANIENVAEQVGYQDAFGFSKVFKKVTGLSPRDFRHQDAQEKQLAVRF